MHFRIGVKLGIESALAKIDIPLEARVILVGFALDNSQRHVICIEPEDGPLTTGHLDGVLARAKALFDARAETSIIYSDRRLNELRLKGLFHRSRADALVEAIEASGVFGGLSFFASGSAPIDKYEVHTCVGVPSAEFNSLPALHESVVDRVYVGRSLQHEVIAECLHQADRALYLPEPGSGISPLGDADDIVRVGAKRLTNGADYRATKWQSDLFARVNAFASLGYERARAEGNLVVASREKVNDLQVRFEQPIRLHQARGMRRLLEISDDFSSVLVDGKGAYGLGSCNSGPDVVEIRITGHAEWELSVDGLKLLRVSYGEAILPKPILDIDEVRDTGDRIVGITGFSQIWKIVQESQRGDRGMTLVVARDPEAEVTRLGAEAVPITPKFLEPGEVLRFGRVDGAVLFGPDGRCHAFGVILDGEASGRGDPARGSRYNSAVRYHGSTCKDSIVVVLSDDGTVDLIPRLRPRVHRGDVEAAVREFEACCTAESVDAEEFVGTHNQVKAFAFYLSESQCRLVNQCYEKEMVRRFEEGGTRIVETPLRPHPEMNESYFFES